MASVIVSMVEYIRGKTERAEFCGVPCAGLPCWLFDPMAYLARIVWCFVEGWVGALTRFTLIGHMFRGEDVQSVAANSVRALKRHLPGVVMIDWVSHGVMGQLYLMN